MTIRERAIIAGLEDEYNNYLADCQAASEYCEEQGWPSTGDNYELMIQAIQLDYPELFRNEEEEEDF